MHALDHAAIERHHTLALVLRLVERGDDLARLRDFIGGRRKHIVARRDLIGMNERLAVEAEIAALLAFAQKTLGIRVIVVYPVENDDAVSTRGENAGCE